MDWEESKNCVNRRKTLKIAGSTLFTTSAIGGIAKGQNNSTSEFKRIIQDSLRYRDAVQEREDWMEFLNRRGVSGTMINGKYKMPREENEDGVGTEEYLKSELDITITLAYNCDKEAYYAELSWRYDDSEEMAYGQSPLDTVAMAYERDWWDLNEYSISGTTETSEYVTTNEEDGFNGEGPAYYMDDEQAWQDENAGSLHYAGVYLTSQGTDENKRRVYGAYVHTYSGLSEGYDVDIGLSYGVVSVTQDSNASWKTRTEDDGDTLLIVNEDGASEDCNS